MLFSGGMDSHRADARFWKEGWQIRVSREGEDAVCEAVVPRRRGDAFLSICTPAAFLSKGGCYDDRHQSVAAQRGRRAHRLSRNDPRTEEGEGHTIQIRHAARAVRLRLPVRGALL